LAIVIAAHNIPTRPLVARLPDFSRVPCRERVAVSAADTATALNLCRLGALKYMHDKGIAHRDLKPENMLMTTKGADAEVKITDFGLSKFFDEQSSLMKTPCGTPGYIAPEVLHMRGYNQQCDVWSMGVITYILLCGFPPFYADNDAQLFEKIKKGQYEFLKPYWDPISDGAKEFVKKMLIVDPAKRATCDQLLQDPWLAGPRSENEAKLHTHKEMPAANEKLKKLKGAFLAAWAVQHD
jgi:serine/threonine protein kinase